MAKKTKDIRIEITQDDKEDEIKYRQYSIFFNNRNIEIILSEESDKLLNKYIDSAYITTVDLIFDKLNYIGENYKIYSYIKNSVICFTLVIDGNVFHNNFTLDNYILNTCFGVCIKNLIKYEYVDFDKYF